MAPSSIASVTYTLSFDDYLPASTLAWHELRKTNLQISGRTRLVRLLLALIILATLVMGPLLLSEAVRQSDYLTGLFQGSLAGSVVVAMLMAFVASTSTRHFARSAFDHFDFSRNPITFAYDDHEVRSELGRAKFALPWSVLTGAYESPTCVYLFFNRVTAIPVSKAALGSVDQLAEFRKLVERHVPIDPIPTR